MTNCILYKVVRLQAQLFSGSNNNIDNGYKQMLQEKIKSHKYTLLGLKFNVGRKMSKAVDDLRKNGIPTGIDFRAFVVNIHGRHESLNDCMFHKI